MSAAPKFDPTASKRLKFLVVGQHNVSTQAVALDLEKQGAQVFRAMDVIEATAMLKVNQIHLVLVHVYYNSRAIVQELKGLCGEAQKIGAPVMMLAAFTTEQDLAECLRVGISDFVLSPCEPKVLIKRMEYQLSKRSAIAVEEIESEESSKSLDLVVNSLKILSGLEDKHRAQYEVLRLLAEFLKSPRVNLVIAEAHVDKAVIPCSSDSKEIKNLETSLSRYPEVFEVLMKGCIIFIEDINKHALTRDIQKNVKTIQIDSLLVVPVKVQGKTVAALSIKLKRKEAKHAEKSLNAIMGVANSLALLLKSM